LDTERRVLIALARAESGHRSIGYETIKLPPNGIKFITIV
jgi:hypothetical protein